MYGIISNKKSLLYSGIILAIALLVFAGLFFYFMNKKKVENPSSIPTQESITQSLTVPKGATSIPIPKEVVHNLLPDFSLGEPKPSINDGETVHVIRFVQTGVVMSFETATTVHKWLGEVISGLQPSVEGEAKNE